MEPSHSNLQEGMDAGIIGGLTVAVWFLILDTIAGHPFFTPSVLGQIVIFGADEPQLSPPLHSLFGHAFVCAGRSSAGLV